MKKPDLHLRIKLKGRYRCVLNEGTDREVDTGWFENLVTNIGLDRLAQAFPAQIFLWASIGTGTNAPAASDTTLQAFVADVSGPIFDSQSNEGPTNYPSVLQFHHVYAQGAVVGNMAEVGVGWASGGGSLFSRSRILDGGGSPTTLTVIPLDQLTVYYELSITNPTADVNDNVTISAVSYAYEGRMANAANFLSTPFSVLNSGSVEWGLLSSAGGTTEAISAYPASSVLGAITSEPSGSPETCGSATVATYTPGNFFRDSTVTVTPSEANLSGGIGCIKLNYSLSTFQYQYQFTPAIPKDNTKTLTLTARLSWGR